MQHMVLSLSMRVPGGLQVHSLSENLSSHSSLSSTPGCSKCLLSQRFPHQNPVCTSSLLYTCYMTRPFHSSGFGRPNIWRGVQIVKLRIIYFSSLPAYLVPHRPEYLPQHPILERRQPMFLPQCERQFHSYTKQKAKLWFCISMFHRAFFNSIIDKHQHMHFFTFKTVLI